MPKLSFRWNLPFEVDPSETECTVEFWYTPGNGKTHLHPQDPDRSDPCIEDIHVHHRGLSVLEDWDEDWIIEMGGEKVMDGFREACENHADEWAEGQIDDREFEKGNCDD